MRFDRDQLVFKALCALDEAVEACRHGPVEPSFGLRFALAFLYAVGDRDRRCHDDFWREMRDPHERAFSEDTAQYMRCTLARVAMTGIARSCGVELTAEVMNQLTAARRRARRGLEPETPPSN